MDCNKDLGSALLDAPGNWGDYRVIEGDPTIKCANGYVYYPWSATEKWGVETDLYASKIDTIEGEFLYCGYFNCHFEILGAFPIMIDDVVTFDRPVRLSCLHIVETTLLERRYIHRKFGFLCRDLGRRLGHQNKQAAVGKIKYFSRSQLKIGTAKFLNEADLEYHLAGLDVDIVHPETLSLKEQIEQMHIAKCVIGVAGSALHLSAFCGEKAIVGISAGQLVNSNFRMIDAVCGNHACYVYPSDLSVVDKPRQFHSAWRFGNPSALAYDLVSCAEALLARQQAWLVSGTSSAMTGLSSGVNQ